LDAANLDSDSEEAEVENFDPNTIGEDGEEFAKRPREEGDDEIAKRRDLKKQRKMIA